MTLATKYLGLTLKNPLVSSASTMNSQLDNIRRLEDAGAGAIVLPSMFQEQIEAEADEVSSRTDAYANSSPEAQTYFPAAITGPYSMGPDNYLNHIRRARAAVGIPIIASLNGSSRAGWADFAKLIEQAGASALELNMYHVPTDLIESGQVIEARYSAIVEAVCGEVALPVAVKLTPYLSSIGHFSELLVAHGAAGLVLFNRLLEPDIDLPAMKLSDQLELSAPEEMRLPMLWIAILSGRIKASLAASTGVSDVASVIKYVLAGADVVMTTSALLRHGVGYMATLVDGLRAWMEEREIGSLADMRGMMSLLRSRDQSVYSRANYIRILGRYATP
jgi:dihydroorotate dehydrogenase (fumarate)